MGKTLNTYEGCLYPPPELDKPDTGYMVLRDHLDCLTEDELEELVGGHEEDDSR